MAIQCSREKVEKSIGIDVRIRGRERLSNSREYFMAWEQSFEGDFERLIPWNARTVYLVKCTIPISLDIYFTHKRILVNKNISVTFTIIISCKNWILSDENNTIQKDNNIIKYRWSNNIDRDLKIMITLGDSSVLFIGHKAKALSKLAQARITCGKANCQASNAPGAI